MFKTAQKYKLAFRKCVSSSIDIDIISTSCVCVGAVMHGTLQRRVELAREIERSPVRTDEQMFGSCLADVARLLWPSKTAVHIAALVGCSERAAEFWLAGQREWSGDAIAALIAEILRRHSMRNVKIVPKR